MIKIISIAVLALLLAACNETPEDRARQIEALDLPSGCTFHDIGSYSSYSRVVVVRCDGKISSTANFTWETGRKHKTRHFGTVTLIEDL